MIRLVLLLASLAWPVTRTHQDLIDLAGKKGDVTHLYDLYTRGPSVSVTDEKFGATGLGQADDTRAIQAAIDTVYNRGGGVVYLPEGDYLVTSLSRHFSTSRSVWIVGAGAKATRIYKNDTLTTPVLTLSADSNVLDIYSGVRDLMIQGNGKRSDGIRLTKAANVTLERLYITACDKAVNFQGALVNTVTNCKLHANRYGAYFRKSGIIYSNLNRFFSGVITGNDSLGIDFDEGANLQFVGTDITSNGTSGVLTSGGVAIRRNITAETGYSSIHFLGVWFESNLGRAFQADSGSDGYISMRDVTFSSNEGGRAILCRGARTLLIENSYSASPGDTWQISPLVGITDIRLGLVNTLLDSCSNKRHSMVTTSAGLIVENVRGVLRMVGSGTPEGSVEAAVSSTYQRTDGGAGTSLYVKESGTGNTGWVAK